MEHKITGKVLTITIDLSAPGEPSKTGKMMLLPGTHGWQSVGTYEGKQISMSLNIGYKR